VVVVVVEVEVATEVAAGEETDMNNHVDIFETDDVLIARAVCSALERSGIEAELVHTPRDMRATGHKGAPKKIRISAADAARANPIVESAVVRRVRIKQMQPKPEPGGLSDGTTITGDAIVGDIII